MDINNIKKQAIEITSFIDSLIKDNVRLYKSNKELEDKSIKLANELESAKSEIEEVKKDEKIKDQREKDYKIQNELEKTALKEIEDWKNLSISLEDKLEEKEEEIEILKNKCRNIDRTSNDKNYENGDILSIESIKKRILGREILNERSVLNEIEDWQNLVKSLEKRLEKKEEGKEKLIDNICGLKNITLSKEDSISSKNKDLSQKKIEKPIIEMLEKIKKLQEVKDFDLEQWQHLLNFGREYNLFSKFEKTRIRTIKAYLKNHKYIDDIHEEDGNKILYKAKKEGYIINNFTILEINYLISWMNDNQMILNDEYKEYEYYLANVGSTNELLLTEIKRIAKVLEKV